MHVVPGLDGTATPRGGWRSRGRGEEDASVVSGRFNGLVSAMHRHRALAGDLTEAVHHFCKVMRSYRPGVFHCYAVPDLPRTNNDLEQLFGSQRYHERRASRRNAASPAAVLRGEVRLTAATATPLRPLAARELGQVNRERWSKLSATASTRGVMPGRCVPASAATRMPTGPPWNSKRASQLCRPRRFLPDTKHPIRGLRKAGRGRTGHHALAGSEMAPRGRPQCEFSRRLAFRPSTGLGISVLFGPISTAVSWSLQRSTSKSRLCTQQTPASRMRRKASASSGIAPPTLASSIMKAAKPSLAAPSADSKTHPKRARPAKNVRSIDLARKYSAKPVLVT